MAQVVYARVIRPLISALCACSLIQGSGTSRLLMVGITAAVFGVMKESVHVLSQFSQWKILKDEKQHGTVDDF